MVNSSPGQHVKSSEVEPRRRSLDLPCDSIRPCDLLLGHGAQVKLFCVEILVEGAAHVEQSLVGLELVPFQAALGATLRVQGCTGACDESDDM